MNNADACNISLKLYRELSRLLPVTEDHYKRKCIQRRNDGMGLNLEKLLSIQPILNKGAFITKPKASSSFFSTRVYL